MIFQIRGDGMHDPNIPRKPLLSIRERYYRNKIIISIEAQTKILKKRKKKS